LKLSIHCHIIQNLKFYGIILQVVSIQDYGVFVKIPGCIKNGKCRTCVCVTLEILD